MPKGYWYKICMVLYVEIGRNPMARLGEVSMMASSTMYQRGRVGASTYL